jgi:hypothetical protein
MTHHLHRRALLHAGLAAAASTLIARPASACEYFGANLRLTHPWTRATVPGASAAVVCMRFDEVTRDDRLIGVSTPVASAAELAGPGVGPALDLPIPQGQETLLEEAGTHVRLLGLKFPLEVGRSYPLQLHFAQGGVIQATLNVDYGRFS